MRYKDISDKLNAFDLHDVPVSNLVLNFEAETISFKLEFYNEDKEDYDARIFLFKEINNLKIPFAESILVESLTDVELSINRENNYHIDLVFIITFSHYNWKISFDFSELEIKVLGGSGQN